MFKPGDRVTIISYEGSDQVERGHREVLKYEDGLLLVNDAGKQTVYNLRSIGLLSVRLERKDA